MDDNTSPTPYNVSVPCNGCTRCCQGDAVRLLPQEDASQWQTEPHPHLAGARMLAHQPNGHCIYLAHHGCSIHGRAPIQCQTMDCRRIAKLVSYTKARQAAKRNILKLSVWKKGRELLALTQLND